MNPEAVIGQVYQALLVSIKYFVTQIFLFIKMCFN